MSALDTFTPAKSFGLGLLLSSVKPKNPLLTVAAATAISEAGLPVGQEAIATARVRRRRVRRGA